MINESEGRIAEVGNTIFQVACPSEHHFLHVGLRLNTNFCNRCPCEEILGTWASSEICVNAVEQVADHFTAGVL